MRCPEVRQTLPRFIDGRVDSQTRQRLGLHLTECEDCSRLINDERFWNNAVVALLDHEAPADLKAQILNDAGLEGSESRPFDSSVDLNQMNWRTKLGFLRWAVTRDNSPRAWFETAALVAGVMLVAYFAPRLFSTGNEEPFRDQGQVAIVTDGQILTPDSPLVSSGLTLDGRFF